MSVNDIYTMSVNDIYTMLVSDRFTQCQWMISTQCQWVTFEQWQWRYLHNFSKNIYTMRLLLSIFHERKIQINNKHFDWLID